MTALRRAIIEGTLMRGALVRGDRVLVVAPVRFCLPPRFQPSLIMVSFTSSLSSRRLALRGRTESAWFEYRDARAMSL